MLETTNITTNNVDLNKTTLNSYLDVLTEYVEINRNNNILQDKSTSQDNQMLKLLKCIRLGKNMNHFLINTDRKFIKFSYISLDGKMYEFDSSKYIDNHPGFTTEKGIPLCNSCENPPELCFCNEVFWR